MPQNVGSTGEDLIGNNIQSRHTELCKADRTSRKLILQDINTTPKEPKTENTIMAKQLSTATTRICFEFFQCRVDILQS